MWPEGFSLLFLKHWSDFVSKNIKLYVFQLFSSFVFLHSNTVASWRKNAPWVIIITSLIRWRVCERITKARVCETRLFTVMLSGRYSTFQGGLFNLFLNKAYEGYHRLSNSVMTAGFLMIFINQIYIYEEHWNLPKSSMTTSSCGKVWSRCIVPVISQNIWYAWAPCPWDNAEEQFLFLINGLCVKYVCDKLIIRREKPNSQDYVSKIFHNKNLIPWWMSESRKNRWRSWEAVQQHSQDILWTVKREAVPQPAAPHITVINNNPRCGG